MEPEAYDLDKHIVPCRKSSDKPPESYLQVLNNAVIFFVINCFGTRIRPYPRVGNFREYGRTKPCFGNQVLTLGFLEKKWSDSEVTFN